MKEYKHIISSMSLSLWLTICMNMVFPVIFFNTAVFLGLTLFIIGTFCLISSVLVSFTTIWLEQISGPLIFIIPYINIIIWIGILKESEEIRSYFFQWSILNPFFCFSRKKYIYIPIQEIEYYEKLFNTKIIHEINHFIIEIKTKEEEALYLLMNK